MWLLRWLPNFVWHFVCVNLGRFQSRGASFDSFLSTYYQVKTTNPKKYFVRPNMGIVMPNAKNEVSSMFVFSLVSQYGCQFFLELIIFCFIVTLQAQEEAPADMQCKDKFLLQSVVTSFGVTTKDITPDMVRC